MGTWAGAIATALVVITTALVALGYFDGFRGPRLRLTFEDPDFDPGFATDLPLDQPHVLRFSVFSDNAYTVTRSLVVRL